MFSFIVLGLFNSTIGVILQPISKHYGLSDIQVSCIFLVGPVGYTLAAQCNSLIHSHFGQRGIAVIGPAFHVLAALAIACHPHFGVVLVAYALIAVGTGLLDGSWCAWAGSVRNANTVSGLLHGSYSVGASAGPYFCDLLMTTGGRPWYQWYSALAVISITELIVLPLAFRRQNAAKYHESKNASSSLTGSRNTRAMFNYAATWVSSLYFLAYVGTETAISGWLVSYMTRDRHVSPSFASLSASGFWVGMAIGRLALGTVTDRIGVRRATTGYLLIAIMLELLFAVVRKPAGASNVLVALLGFFMGPMFPSGIVVLARLLPRDLHVAAVSFVASLGQVGGALLPFAIGACVQGWGIGVFVYAIIVFTSVALALWVAFSRLPRTGASSVFVGRE
ncbi:MFS general substrate transporter [Aaosphaeria arxii CBS 175.79]|uniref:MFS general substrate transporter n=1 Tax=Aaosphaeria arxii CBS 175.79 TaxID=1450172 RepID=A0A6A5XWI3_9PLEO|nr:MFS general substrate transporter [Aaosphaeria arxii CBS 175.79]KAF2017695.1 MFS general substrate transporter [Aaosphaeria arxii CBS 175.79]